MMNAKFVRFGISHEISEPYLCNKRIGKQPEI